MDFDGIIKWLNENPGVLALSAILLPLGGYLGRVLQVWLKNKKEIRCEIHDAIDHVLKIKQEIKGKIRWIDNVVGYGSILIRNLHPSINYKAKIPQKGISPYFRVGFAGSYENGIMVHLGVAHIDTIKEIETKGNWYHCEYDDTDGVTVALIGKIPYRWIYKIDWDGDGCYCYPHFYCAFDSKDAEPYEELVYCKKVNRREGDFYFSEIISWDEVKGERIFK